MEVQTTDVEVVTYHFTPSPELVNEAHARQRAIIDLGEEIASRRQKQLEHLRWFSEDEKRCVAAGHKNFLAMLRDPEIGRAVWGGPIKTDVTAFRVQRMVELQFYFGPDEDVDVFELLPRSITSTGLMTKVEEMAGALPPKTDPKRAQAVEQFLQDVNNIGLGTYRQNRDSAKVTLRASFPFDYTTKHGMVRYLNGHGPMPVLKLEPGAGALAALALVKLVATQVDSWTMDDDELTAWVGGSAIKVATVLTQDKKVLNAIADALHATRK